MISQGRAILAFFGKLGLSDPNILWKKKKKLVDKVSIQSTMRRGSRGRRKKAGGAGG